MQTIRENQVVLVLGETGSGKTTQVRSARGSSVFVFTQKYVVLQKRVFVRMNETMKCLFVCQIPQFLLDDSSRNGIPCRIFCTQPRRLATIAVAERVAAERGEKIGQTVGYQIRLESRYCIKVMSFQFCVVIFTAFMGLIPRKEHRSI